MTDVLHVERREKMGSAASRRIRQKGRVPAVLYGHGETNEHLSVDRVEVSALVRNHGKTVTLDGAVQDTALVSQVQWDPLGIEVLHLDLIRVNLKEMVEVLVPIRLHGEAVGLRQGGSLIENCHELEIRCSAGGIPEELELNVSDLALGHSLTADNVKLPEGVTLVTAADVVVAHIEVPRGSDVSIPEETSGPTSPEVIGRKAEEEEG